jgi:glyoxylase-like metal-dependent hydrolase (beta-lactamase superfamily II)
MPLEVDRLELGPIGTNTYVVRSGPDSGDAVVVDPSGEAAAIRQVLSERGAGCAAIFVTHGHFDHVVSLADLADETGAPVYAPAGERVLIEEPSTFSPAGFDIRGTTADVWLEGGETLDVAGISFAVTAVPGHSPAHLAYFARGDLFSGDVLFAGSVGRTDLPGGDWSVLLASISSLLDAYPAETVVHPGHGPETTLAAELARNPFLVDLRAARSAP